MALAAPRILKEPMGWRHSSLSQTGGPGLSGSRGVRTAAPSMRRRADSMDSTGTGASGSMRAGWRADLPASTRRDPGREAGGCRDGARWGRG